MYAPVLLCFSHVLPGDPLYAGIKIIPSQQCKPVISTVQRGKKTMLSRLLLPLSGRVLYCRSPEGPAVKFWEVRKLIEENGRFIPGDAVLLDEPLEKSSVVFVYGLELYSAFISRSPVLRVLFAPYDMPFCPNRGNIRIQQYVDVDLLSFGNLLGCEDPGAPDIDILSHHAERSLVSHREAVH